MTKFRARTCPRCNYFLGFSVAKPLADATKAAVTSFCLNCSYRLPVHAVIYGIRRATVPLRRARSKLAIIINKKQRSDGHANETAAKTEKTMLPNEYSRELRVIGQALEKQGIETFNLECTESGYRISNRGSNELLHLVGARPDHSWGVRHQAQALSRALNAHANAPLSYGADELQQMEDVAKGQRLPNGDIADGHSLSHLLRTIGILVKQRNQRLLAISWRDLTVCIIVETVRGKRQLDVFRPDNLYDLWVRMYLRRENRALSDVPS
jgi:hypothetical protein